MINVLLGFVLGILFSIALSAILPDDDKEGGEE